MMPPSTTPAPAGSGTTLPSTCEVVKAKKSDAIGAGKPTSSKTAIKQAASQSQLRVV